MTLLRRVCAGSCITVLGLLPGAADAVKPAPGAYSVSFDDEELIYRLTKSDPDLDAEAVDCKKISGITKGRIAVDCDLEIDEDGIEGSIEGPVLIKAFRTNAGRTKIRFNAEFDGEVSFEGDDFDAEVVLKGGGKVQPGESTVSFRAKSDACLDDVCATDRERVEIDIATGDGSWTLDMTLVDAAGDAIAGEAVVAFADDKTVRFDATGSHDPDADLSTIVLSARNGKPGLKIKLKRIEVIGDDLAGRLKYRLFGHVHGLDVVLDGTPAP